MMKDNADVLLLRLVPQPTPVRDDVSHRSPPLLTRFWSTLSTNRQQRPQDPDSFKSHHRRHGGKAVDPASPGQTLNKGFRLSFPSVANQAMQDPVVTAPAGPDPVQGPARPALEVGVGAPARGGVVRGQPL